MSTVAEVCQRWPDTRALVLHERRQGGMRADGEEVSGTQERLSLAGDLIPDIILLVNGILGAMHAPHTYAVSLPLMMGGTLMIHALADGQEQPFVDRPADGPLKGGRDGLSALLPAGSELSEAEGRLAGCMTKTHFISHLALRLFLFCGIAGMFALATQAAGSGRFNVPPETRGALGAIGHGLQFGHRFGLALRALKAQT